MRSWLALTGLSMLLSGCAELIGLDDYEEARLANGAASFDSYRFRSGAASFSVDAASGLLANEGVSSRVLSTGRLRTRRGGSVELAEDGSFTYTPPGAAGVFWGDDVLQFSLQRGGVQDDAAEARFTVQPLALDMTTIPTNPESGFARSGAMFDFLGLLPGSMRSAGDFNGDGSEDLVLGAPGLELRGLGVLVELGVAADGSPRAARPEARLTLVNGDRGDQLGLFSVAGAGDVNGDGFDDIIAGAPGLVDLVSENVEEAESPTVVPGRAYVLYGRAESTVVTIEELIADPALGFYLEGGLDALGVATAGAGDVNGDGFDDIIVGAPFASDGELLGNGAAYVVFGGPDQQALSLPDPGSAEAVITDGFVITGARTGDGLGVIVWPAGDVNGDGLDDVLVTAGGASFGERAGVGAVYVVFGKRDTNTVHLLDFELDTAQGFMILGADEGDAIADALASGDMNGDGLSDIAIGASDATVGAANGDDDPPGAAYVVFGKREPGNLELSAVERGSGEGYAIIGAPPLQSLGLSMSAGDLDSDGLVDLMLGSFPSDELSKSYVVLGKPDSSNVELAAIEVGEPGGLPLFGPGIPPETAVLPGYGVSSGSDLNADGIDDLVIGTTPDGAPPAAGGFYAVYGWDMSGALGARRGSLIGTSGNDTFDLPEAPLIAARGGHGADTLRVTGSGRVLDLRPSAPRFESLEVIDLSGSGPNTLIIDEKALRNTPASSRDLPFGLAKTLTVLSDGDDTLYFDLRGYAQAGAREGRLVYVREGAYYGLEISPGLRVTWPPP